MLSFLTSEAFGFTLNFITVMCFTGLHEVARELESPFDNVPNDVPLNNFQAQFNEALMTMFAGYHPDAYWEVTEKPLPPPTFPASSQLDSHMEFAESVMAAKDKHDQLKSDLPSKSADVTDGKGTVVDLSKTSNVDETRLVNRSDGKGTEPGLSKAPNLDSSKLGESGRKSVVVELPKASLVDSVSTRSVQTDDKKDPGKPKSPIGGTQVTVKSSAAATQSASRIIKDEDTQLTATVKGRNADTKSSSGSNESKLGALSAINGHDVEATKKTKNPG